MTDNTLRIAVASQNPVKIRATELGFRQMFPGRMLRIDGASVPSGVSDQPMTDEETLDGARNRARNVRDALPEYDFWVGIEGGIEPHGDELEAFAWAVVLDGHREGRSRSCSFQLPDEMSRLVHEGVELGDASDVVFGTDNSKHDQGAVGLLTHGVIDRTELYRPAVVLALAPFVWKMAHATSR